MLTVNEDVAGVESDLSAGQLLCPGCGAALAPWGWARPRAIRAGVGDDYRNVLVRPRRARCQGCGTTHVLLGLGLAGRRADSADVLAAAIVANVATGQGHRTIATQLGRPASTVRGWLRNFQASATAMAQKFTSLAHRDGADAASLWPVPAATIAGQALAAVTAYAQVLADRFGVGMLTWQTAGLVSLGPWFFSARWWADQQHQLALSGGRHGG